MTWERGGSRVWHPRLSVVLCLPRTGSRPVRGGREILQLRKPQLQDDRRRECEILQLRKPQFQDDGRRGCDIFQLREPQFQDDTRENSQL